MKIAIIKGLLVSYSEGFYDRLLSKKNINVTIYTQSEIPGLNLKTAHHKYPNHVKLVKHFTLNKEKASWQFLPWREIINGYDVYVITGNPRNISNVMIASFLKLIGKKVVLWTMGHSFDANTWTEKIRLWWTSFFDYILLYTDYEVKFFRENGFDKQYIVGQNNGLDQKSIDACTNEWDEERLKQWKATNGIANKKVILSCSRLSAKNKFDQIIEILPNLTHNHPDILWVVIGDGEEAQKLKDLVIVNNLELHVRFIGALYEEEKLAPWFLSAKVFVHPAAIGLSLLHAFGYGLTVITHNMRTAHGPEYAAYQEGGTGFGFTQDSIVELESCIHQTLLLSNQALEAKGKYVQSIVREQYNVDIMVSRFIQIVEAAHQ
jgi:glycosyltransferase involved in cell wall biosynthesis